MGVVPRVYGGVGAEKRREERRRALLAAGLHVLGERGHAATSVRAVCAEAGLSPRYFYESFPDLDALLVAVFDDIATDIGAAVLTAAKAAPADARSKAHAAIAAFVALLTDEPAKARILFDEARGSEALARRRWQTLHALATVVAEAGRSFYGAPRRDRLTDVTAFMLVGGLTETFMAWLDGRLEATPAQLVDDCAELFVATGEGAVALARSRAARS